mmetsp:Transcript_12689/g.19962  ORF Transcript_12689/g.19962 Transcript_12689/m.19962 type:complete len:166 (-) Transcript_12689:20-517(-)
MNSTQRDSGAIRGTQQTSTFCHLRLLQREHEVHFMHPPEDSQEHYTEPVQIMSLHVPYPALLTKHTTSCNFRRFLHLHRYRMLQILTMTMHRLYPTIQLANYLPYRSATPFSTAVLGIALHSQLSTPAMLLIWLPVPASPALLIILGTDCSCDAPYLHKSMPLEL